MDTEKKQIKLFELIKKGLFDEKNCFNWIGCKDKDGYGITCYVENGEKKSWKVHRLIFFLLNGYIPKGLYICHACDNPSCFNINHLFICTSKENAQDKKRKGRCADQKGEKNNSSILNEVTVLKIRSLYKNGKKISELVKIFNISQPTISKIVHRQRWKHI